MKWYKVEEKLPKDKTLVVVWYGAKTEVVDGRIDRTVYNTYKMAFYEDGLWKDMSDFSDFNKNLADKYRIDKWYEIPSASK
jgi:hypothetical protein